MGNIGNAFIQAHTKKNFITKCGPEFGDRLGSIAITVRAFYGLTISAERFRAMLAYFIRTLEFIPSRFEREVWMILRDDKTGYYYMCTHVDDFKVVAKNPLIWIDRIESMFLIKEHDPRNYYLRNDYTYHSGKNMWTYGCQTYAKESVAHVERVYGYIPKKSTLIQVTYCHPELYNTPYRVLMLTANFKCY